MKSRDFIRVALILMFVSAFCGSSHHRLPVFVSQCSDDSMVKGVVFFGSDSRIPGAAVVIEGAGIKKETKSNEFGEYEFQVPTGLYKITANAGDWYYNLKRAAFRVAPGSVTKINLRPVLRILSAGIELNKGGLAEPISTAPPPQYDYYYPHAPKDRLLDMMVQFHRKSVEREIVSYDEVTLTYDSLTVIARRVQMNTKSFEIEARGKVMVDIGYRVVESERAIIDIHSRSINSILTF